jgi:Fe-S-cluster containining protein
LARHLELLKFRCTGCGNCCRDPLLPLTDADIARITERTALGAADIVKWVSCREIDLDAGSESFVSLRVGPRVMVLRHTRGHCRFLGDDDRCSIYSFRPLGCRIFPFDPDFERGKLVRLRMIDATDCPYESNGSNDVNKLLRLNQDTERELAVYHGKVADWNREQARRRRRGHAPSHAAEFLRYLGLG